MRATWRGVLPQESRASTVAPCCTIRLQREKEFFIANLLVRIHFIVVMIRWTGLAPWEFDGASTAAPCCTIRLQIVKRFRGGLVFKAHILLHQSTLGLRVIQKRTKKKSQADVDGGVMPPSCPAMMTSCGLLLLFVFTLVKGPRRSLSLKMIDRSVNEP